MCVSSTKKDLLANYMFLIFRASFGNSSKYSFIQTSPYEDCERRNYSKIKNIVLVPRIHIKKHADMKVLLVNFLWDSLNAWNYTNHFFLKSRSQTSILNNPQLMPPGIATTTTIINTIIIWITRPLGLVEPQGNWRT